MIENIICLSAISIVLLGIYFVLREIKYQLKRLADMFNKKYKYFD